MVELGIMVIGKLIKVAKTMDEKGDTHWRKVTKDGSHFFIDGHPMERQHRTFEQEIVLEWDEDVIEWYTPEEYHKEILN